MIEAGVLTVTDGRQRQIARFSLGAELIEKISSKYGYVSGYLPEGVRSIAGQVKILHWLFPDLGSADEKLAENRLPPNAEGYFAIPRKELIAPTGGVALQKVLDKIADTRQGCLKNYCADRLGSRYLRPLAKTAAAFQKIGAEQTGYDILVVPAQFGRLYTGYSFHRARQIMAPNEFGLDAFSAGIMLLTHPERLQELHDLSIYCAGDEFSPGASGIFSQILRFCLYGNQIEFSATFIDITGGSYGLVSGFGQ